MRAKSYFGSRRDNIPPLLNHHQVSWRSRPDNDRVVGMPPRATISGINRK